MPKVPVLLRAPKTRPVVSTASSVDHPEVIRACFPAVAIFNSSPEPDLERGLSLSLDDNTTHCQFVRSQRSVALKLAVLPQFGATCFGRQTFISRLLTRHDSLRRLHNDILFQLPCFESHRLAYFHRSAQTNCFAPGTQDGTPEERVYAPPVAQLSDSPGEPSRRRTLASSSAPNGSPSTLFRCVEYLDALLTSCSC